MRKQINTFKQGDILQRWGQEWEVLKRFGDIALIQQTVEGSKRYCVVEIQSYSKDHTWPNGSVTPEGSEFLPHENTYGTKAWQFIGIEGAEKCFLEKSIEK